MAASHVVRWPRYSITRVPLRIGCAANTPRPWMGELRTTYGRLLFAAGMGAGRTRRGGAEKTRIMPQLAAAGKAGRGTAEPGGDQSTDAPTFSPISWTMCARPTSSRSRLPMRVRSLFAYGR